MHQGYTINGDPSACWVWCGNYRKRDSEPIIYICHSSYFPRALMAKKVGVKGIMKNKCNHKNCINPAHLLFVPYKSQMVCAAKEGHSLGMSSAASYRLLICLHSRGHTKPSKARP